MRKLSMAFLKLPMSTFKPASGRWTPSLLSKLWSNWSKLCGITDILGMRDVILLAYLFRDFLTRSRAKSLFVMLERGEDCSRTGAEWWWTMRCVCLAFLLEECGRRYQLRFCIGMRHHSQCYWYLGARWLKLGAVDHGSTCSPPCVGIKSWSIAPPWPHH